MKRYIIILTFAVMLAFTGCGKAEDTETASAVQNNEDMQAAEEDEDTEGEPRASVGTDRLKGIDENKLGFLTESEGTIIRREAVLTMEEADEIVEMINSAPKEIGCTNSEDNIWFTDGDTRVYIQVMPDGKTYANIYGSHQKAAELTEEKKNRLKEIIKAETGLDPLT